MAKLGFNGQWIVISRIGSASDSKGVQRDLTRDYLNSVISNYMAGQHEAPLVVGHPESDSAPAYGWATELRLNGDDLEARFADTDDGFEQLVADGRFKKRSASFYLDPPNLRHIGFLGAQPPAIKGLRDITFAAFTGGESFALEESFTQEKKMKEEDLDKLPESFLEKLKAKLGLDKKVDLKEGGNPVPQPATTAQFSEADVKSLIADAVKTVKEEVTTDFSEKLKAKDDEMKTLKETVDAGTASGRRSEIVSFVESLPAEKGKHFLKRAGIVEFLEALAVADGRDKEKAISFSEGTGDDKTEHKFSRLEWAKTLISELPSFIEFGEKFGSMKATAAADVVADNGQLKNMREAMGLKTEAAGGEK